MAGLARNHQAQPDSHSKSENEIHGWNITKPFEIRTLARLHAGL
jgi:hypothetical protein